MKILSDTHAFIWWNLYPEKLSRYATELLEDKNNQILLSIASVWEMQIKINLGKLQLDLPLPELVLSQIEVNNIEILPIELYHIWTLEQLFDHHKDPFDRILIAQSISENISLISVDNIFDNYDKIQRLW
jgi:PIN domain nuclease of toxin-antitoxin system